jgi:hypothetical protein
LKQSSPAVCSVEGCGRTQRGPRTPLCSRHYDRQRLRGTNEPSRCPPGVSIEEKLHWHGWDEVPGPLDTPCWVTRVRKNKDGYGSLKHEGRYEGAHRWAYRAWNGPIPEDKILRHRCDNPPCINPRHLIPGSIADNMQDAVERGSFKRRILPDNRGELNPMSRISDRCRDDIVTAFKGGQSVRSIAKAHYLSYGMVWRITKTWKNL